MRPIDRTNYEAWLLDQLEGRLSQEEARTLDAFLATNPDLRPDGGDLPVIGSGTIPFDEKDGMKRELPPTGMPNMQVLDDYLVARLEGGLSPAQEAALDELLSKDATAMRAWSLMQRTRVSVGPAAFPDKARQALKRALPPMGMPATGHLDDFLVARLEGELTPEQDVALDDLLKTDAAAARSWSLMQRTRVLPVALQFPDKPGLRKERGRVIAMVPRTSPAWQRLAIAASIALVLGLGWWALTQGGGDLPSVADKEHAVDPEESNNPTVPEEQQPVPPLEEKPAPLAEAERDKKAPDSRSIEEEPVDETVPMPMPSTIVREPAPERIAPLMAQSPGQEPTPVGASIPDVPVSDDPPVEFAENGVENPASGTMTLGELLATTVRQEVLDQPDAPTHALDRNDAAALLDKSLGAVSGDKAGLTYQRDQQRRRFRLHLGDNLAFAASTSR